MPKIRSPFGALSSYSFEESLNRKAAMLEKEGEVRHRDAAGEYSDEFQALVAERDVESVYDIVEAMVTGRHPDKYKIKDVMMSQDFPKLVYTATDILMQSRIVPNRVVSQYLFNTIPYNGAGEEVTIRTLGGVRVEEVPEGAQYPETSSALSDQAYRVKLEIKKYGAKVAGTRELIESDNWGIFAYTVQQLAQELLNKRERLCVDMLNEEAGQVLIDNADAASVPLGSTTGRDITGAQNGALGVDDLMNLMSYMQIRGYDIDTVLVHPFAWTMWVRDPEIREIVLGSQITYMPSGSAAAGWGDVFNFGGLGVPYSRFGSTIPSTTPAAAQAGLLGFNTPDTLYGKLGVAPYAYPNLTPFGATFQTQPKFTGRPLTVIVSPYVPYYQVSSGSRAGKYATNLIFADSKRCGIILQKENPTMEEWKDIEREIDFVKIREKYGLAMLEQGRGVAVAKNIVIDRTYTFDNVNSQVLSPLSTSGNLI